MSEKVRVHEIAKELGIDSKEVVTKASEMGVVVKSASSSVSMEDAEKIANFIINGAPAPKPTTPKVTVKKAVAKEEEAPKSEENVAQEKPAEKVEETKAATSAPEAKATEAAAQPAAEKAHGQPMCHQPPRHTSARTPSPLQGATVGQRGKERFPTDNLQCR